MIKIAGPVDDLDQWTRSVDQLLNSIFLNENRVTPAMWRPPTDVYETGDRVVIRVEIAGLSAADFQISFSNHILQIQGSRIDNDRKRCFHRLEIAYGEFLSQVYLPGQYNQDEIDARYDNGFLTITLPKVELEPQTIEVHSDS